MKKKNLVLISIVYLLVFVLFYFLNKQYDNIFTNILLIVTVLAWLIHIITASIIEGLQTKKIEEMQKYVEEKELQEKYDKYKSNFENE